MIFTRKEIASAAGIGALMGVIDVLFPDIPMKEGIRIVGYAAGLAPWLKRQGDDILVDNKDKAAPEL